MSCTTGVAEMHGCKFIRRHRQGRREGKAALYVKVALVVWNLMMFTIGLGVGKDKGEGQQGRYHGESPL